MRNFLTLGNWSCIVHISSGLHLRSFPPFSFSFSLLRLSIAIFLFFLSLVNPHCTIYRNRRNKKRIHNPNCSIPTTPCLFTVTPYWNGRRYLIHFGIHDISNNCNHPPPVAITCKTFRHVDLRQYCLCMRAEHALLVYVFTLRAPRRRAGAVVMQIPRGSGVRVWVNSRMNSLIVGAFTVTRAVCARGRELWHQYHPAMFLFHLRSVCTMVGVKPPWKQYCSWTVGVGMVLPFSFLHSLR